MLNPDPVRLTLVPPDPELGSPALMAGRTRPRSFLLHSCDFVTYLPGSW